MQKALGQRGVVLVLRLDTRAEVGAQFGWPDGERGVIVVPERVITLGECP
jgi:hypothetical protein